MSQPLPIDERKDLGAFYTQKEVARFLVEWGLEDAPGSLMDPSCGDGRFLEIAGRLRELRLVGCDISQPALDEAQSSLRGAGLDAEWISSDFFAVEPSEIDPVDLVVGNPPFIRYQRFDDASRRKALRSALRVGVRLSRLTSSWAPFLLHAMQFLRPEGRLAMVVPAEIKQTQYGLRTLRALLEHFGSVLLIAFERNFFEDAQEETCLLLASGFGGQSRHVHLLPLVSIQDLEDSSLLKSSKNKVQVPLQEDAFARFAEAYLSPSEQRVWHRVKQHPQVQSLASLARVTNGYVTGDNAFFHRTLAESQEAGFPPTWLIPVARSSKSLQGLTFEPGDIERLEARNVAHHLIVPQEDLFLAADRPALERWIQEGEERGTPERFKCRQRQPWWRVPGIQSADVLVSYMAGAFPRAAVNRAQAAYCNSLHGLRLHNGSSPERLTLALYSSLSLLSFEIEGRSYGGGILKLEPRELDRVLVPWPEISEPKLLETCERVDCHLRQGQYDRAREIVDDLLLRRGLRLSKETVVGLSKARQRLVERRLGKTCKD